MGNNLEESEGTKGAFWSKPEGWLTIGVLGVLAFFGVKHLDTFMMHVANILSNTFYSMVALAGIGVFLFLVTNKQVRIGVSFMWRLLARKMFSIIIETDPIGLLKIQIEDAKKEHAKINEQIDKVAGQKGELEKIMNDNVKKATQQLEFAIKAKEKGYKQEAALASADAASLEQMNQNFLPLFQKLTKVLELLEKIYTNSDFLIKKTSMEVKHKEIEYNAIKASHGALSSAMRIFKGDSDKNLVFEQALEFINADMGQKIGEMKRAMKMSKDFMTTIDIENGVFNDRGLELLEKFEKGDLKLLSAESVNTIELPNAQGALPMTRGLNTKPIDSYTNLLD